MFFPCLRSCRQPFQYLLKLTPWGAIIRPTCTFSGTEDTSLPGPPPFFSSLPMLTIPFYFPPLTGEHLHCGLWRHVPRDSPGPAFCLPLHRFRDHPQRDAHFHPLQQILRLLQQAQGLRVHRHTKGKGECGVHAESQKEDSWVLGRKQPTAQPKAK